MLPFSLKHYSRVIIKPYTRLKCVYSLKCFQLTLLIDAVKVSHTQYVMMVWKGRSTSMSSKERINIKRGLKVSIVLKDDQRSGKLSEGIVKDILTKSQFHPHGIKVRLENGLIGRVKVIK